MFVDGECNENLRHGIWQWGQHSLVFSVCCLEIIICCGVILYSFVFIKFGADLSETEVIQRDTLPEDNLKLLVIVDVALPSGYLVTFSSHLYTRIFLRLIFNSNVL